MDRLLGWQFDIVPDLSFNIEREPFWSPEVYQAVVWDNALSIECSAKARLTLEFAKIAYFTFEIETTLLRWAVGLQQFLMEDYPSHLCWMFYTDSRIATVGLNFETNTKPCKISPSFLDKYNLHFGTNLNE